MSGKGLIQQGQEKKEGKLLLRGIMTPKHMGGIRQKVETGVKGGLQCLLCVNHRGAEQKLLFFLLLFTPFLIGDG